MKLVGRTIHFSSEYTTFFSDLSPIFINVTLFFLGCGKNPFRLLSGHGKIFSEFSDNPLIRQSHFTEKRSALRSYPFCQENSVPSRAKKQQLLHHLVYIIISFSKRRISLHLLYFPHGLDCFRIRHFPSYVNYPLSKANELPASSTSYHLALRQEALPAISTGVNLGSPCPIYF